LEKSFHGKIRPVLRKVHKILGAAIPVIGYVQIILGVIASLGFCYGGNS
jgi:choline-glycine betaine transporter